MKPELWGKYLWSTIHFVALGYPENPSANDKQSYYDFYTSFGKMIPCSKCRVNYARHLREIPIEPYLNSRYNLFKWTVLVHNIVNRELGKQQWNIDYALTFYTNMDANNTNEHTEHLKQFGYIAVISLNVVVCILIIIWLSKNK